MPWWKQLQISPVIRLAALLVCGGQVAFCPVPADAAGDTAGDGPSPSQPVMPLPAGALPDAAPGECFAEVRLPERTLTETFEVVLREAAYRYEITPAELQTRMQDVVVQDAYTRITAVQPEMRRESHTVELAPAGSRWVRDSLQGRIPLSDGEKADLREAGVAIEQIPVGVCLSEYWQAPVVRTQPVRVLTREASERLNVIPARFRERQEQVVLRPPLERLIEIPAVYGEEAVPVLMEAAHAVWVPGSGPIQRIDAETGEILCRVDRPAVYDTVTRAVVDEPATTTRVHEPAELHTLSVQRLDTDAQSTRSPLPAEFTTLERPVVDVPGAFAWQPSTRADSAVSGVATGRQVCHQPLPAVAIDYEREVVARAGRFEYEQIPERRVALEVQTLLNPAVAGKVAIPALTETRERVLAREPARLVWQPVLCRTNITESVVRRLQQALVTAGFDPGPVDGKLGRATLAAVEAYQRSHRLGHGELTLETLDGLGVQLATAPDE